MRITALSVAMVAVALGGCTVNPRRSLPQVQSVVQQQTGQRVQWQSGAPGEQEAEERVKQMLAGTITADDAVGIALLKNPSIQATLEELGIAEADLVQAGLLKNPVFSVAVQFPGRPHTRVDASIEAELLDLLFLPLRKKTAGAEFERARASVTDAILRKAMEVRIAYFRRQADRQLVETQDQVVAALDASATAARELQKAGNLAAVAVRRSERDLVDVRLERRKLQGEMAGDEDDLLALLGMGAGATLNLPAELPPLPPVDVSLEGAQASAVAHRQDLAAARAQVESAVAMAAYTNVAALLNGGSAGIAYTRDPDVKSTLGPQVTITIPLFDQGQAAVVRAQGQLRQAHDRYLELLNSVRAEVRKRHEEMTAARQQVELAHAQLLPMAQEALSQALTQYNAMQIDLFELLQDRQAVSRAQRLEVEGMRDYWIAASRLAYEAGLTMPGAAPQPVESAPATMPDHSTMHH